MSKPEKIPSREYLLGWVTGYYAAYNYFTNDKANLNLSLLSRGKLFEIYRNIKKGSI